MTKKSQKKRGVNHVWVLSAVIAIIVMTTVLILSQRQTPPIEKPALIRSALVNACRELGYAFYSDLSPDMLTNACYQEAIDLYAAHPDAANACYDVIPIDAAVAWGECMLDQGTDFSGVYLSAARNR